MLILDLDDTIFETKSINSNIFAPAISLIKEYYKSNPGIDVEEIISELWSKPIDVVFSKYNIPQPLASKFYQAIANIDYKALHIQTFDDYQVIKSFPNKKILVTTGLKELQIAKIKALGISSDFDAIFIDDPRKQPRQFKFNIFQQILHESKMPPAKIWVIGDNPDSEIKAAKRLGMNTIQRLSKSKTVSELSDYKIQSFNELVDII